MEGVAVASSFAGILAFVGQSLNGILKLRAFFKDISSAPRRINDLLKEMDDLRDVMTQIQQFVNLLERTPEEKLKGTHAIHTIVLKAHVQSCADDIEAWVSFTEKLDPRTEKGVRAFFRNVKVVADKTGFEEFGKKISGHEQRIGITLSVLGRIFDYLSIERIDALGVKFDGLTEVHLKLSNQINEQVLAAQEAPKKHEEILESILGKQLNPLNNAIIEALEDQVDRMSIYHSESQSSMNSISESLSSLTSHISRLMEKPSMEESGQQPVNPPPSGMEWCCDAISGIDDAFEDQRDDRCACLYCLESFYWNGNDNYAHQRGTHLSKRHAFGACNLAMSYQSWESLQQHLIVFHNMHTDATSIQEKVYRRKRPVKLFRGEPSSNGHPLVEEAEASTLGKILLCKLQSTLISNTPRDQRDWSIPIAIFDINRMSLRIEVLEDEIFNRVCDFDQFHKLPAEIACIEEELIIYRNEDLMSRSLSREQSVIESYLKDQASKGAIQDRESVSHGKRCKISHWLLHVLRSSVTLRTLLRSGVVAEGLKLDFTHWILEVLKFWERDGAATGLESW